MKPDTHEAMLPRLAQFAVRHPRLYRARVLALAAFGYGLILGLLIFLVAALVLTAVGAIRTGEAALLKLAVPLLVFIGVLVDALNVEIRPPKGIVLGRNEAPALWAEIDRVRRAMRAPALHQVLIDGELNASVMQVPRLGVVGFYRTYLTIGLPLTASLTPDEFRSILAHELGHVSGKHGRLGVWIYRVQATWTEVLSDLEQSRHWTRGLFRAFVRWYAPFFDAYTAVLRRAHEFDADRAAAGVAGAGTAAAALCRVHLAAAYLETDFWPAVFADVGARPTAPDDVYRRLLAAAPGVARHAHAPAWLEREAGRTTEPWDTHPSLADRLASLGAQPALPAPLAESAATAFFGQHLERIADRLGRRWWDATQFTWSKQHQEHQAMRARLAALEANAGSQPLPAVQARERILLTVELHGQTVAMPLMRDFLDAGQDDPAVRFLMGRTLLEGGDEAGLRHLDRAMELDVDLTPAACALAAGFLESRGREQEAGASRQRNEAYLLTLQHARGERDVNSLSARDRFLPHGLTAEQAAAVATRIAGVHAVRRALLVRKEVTLRAETPCYVLGVETVPDEIGQLSPEQVARQLLNAVSLPGTVLLVDLTHTGWLARAAGKIPGAEVYRRGAPARALAR